MSDPALSPIYERLNGAGGYHPFTANTFTDWSSEAGDTVTISRNGTEYAAPIHKQTITWRGQPRVTMETGGNLEREPTERVSDRKFKSTKSAARTNSGKTHTFEVNDQHFLYEIDNPTTGIKTRLQVAENDITAEVTRATTAEGGIRTDVSSLQVTIDGITQTVGTIENEVDTLDGKVTTIEGSALWTQRDNITGVVGEFDVVTDAQTGTKTLVVKSGGGLNIRRNGAEFGVYDDGTLTAGVIATKVNGVASTNIYGSNIVMSATDNTPVNVVINGKVTAEDISAQFIQARISDISMLRANALTVDGGIMANGTLTVTNLATFNGSVRLGSGNSFNKCIVSATVNSTTNTLTLVDSNGDAVNFSKAASITLDGNWSGTTYTVTANAGSTVVDTISTSVALDLYGSGNIVGAKVRNGTTELDGKSAQLTENIADRKVYCNLSSGSQSTIAQVSTQATYNAGWDYAITQRVVSAASTTDQQIKTLDFDEKWKVTFTIPNSSGTNVTSSYVVKGPSDPYTLASVTLQGSAISGTVYHTVSSGGVTYYTAGADVTYYKGDGGTVTVQGNPAGTCYPVVTSGGTVYYTAGSSYTVQGTPAGTCYPVVTSGGTVYYKAGSSYTVQGSSAGTCYPVVSSGGTVYYTAGSSYTVQGTEGPKLKHWGYGLLFRYVNGTYVPVVEANWYHDHNGDKQYYNAGTSSVTAVGSTSIRLGSSGVKYNAGTSTVTAISNTSVRLGTSGLKYNAGTSTVTAISNTSVRLGTSGLKYNAGTITAETRGDSVTVTPIGGTSLMLVPVVNGGYNAGSTVTDTYYTKS